MRTCAKHRRDRTATATRPLLDQLRRIPICIHTDAGVDPFDTTPVRLDKVKYSPALALSIYADVKADELRAVGASLFG